MIDKSNQNHDADPVEDIHSPLMGSVYTETSLDDADLTTLQIDSEVVEGIDSFRILTGEVEQKQKEDPNTELKDLLNTFHDTPVDPNVLPRKQGEAEPYYSRAFWADQKYTQYAKIEGIHTSVYDLSVNLDRELWDSLLLKHEDRWSNVLITLKEIKYSEPLGTWKALVQWRTFRFLNVPKPKDI